MDEGGLSPRVRGNLDPTAHKVGLSRSIPASAGEPEMEAEVADEPEVYPRECGGTQAPLLDVNFFEGLSPRVRGNRIFGPRSLGL